MKLIHDGKTVLAIIDGDRIFTDGVTLEAVNEIAGARAKIEELALSVGISCLAAVAETDDDRRAYGLLADRAAIDDTLGKLALSPQAAADVAAATAPKVGG